MHKTSWKIKLMVTSNRSWTDPSTCLDESSVESEVSGAKLLNSYIESAVAEVRRKLLVLQAFNLTRCHFHLCLCWILLLAPLGLFFFLQKTGAEVWCSNFSLAASFLPARMIYSVTGAVCSHTHNKTLWTCHEDSLNPSCSSQGKARKGVSVGRLLSHVQDTK